MLFRSLHHAPCSVRVVPKGPLTGGPIHLLAATDGSAGGRAAVEAVAARSWPAGTSVTVLGVVETLVPPSPVLIPGLETRTFAEEPAFQRIWESDEHERARMRNVVEEAATRLERAGLKATPLVVDGAPRTDIVAQAEKSKVDAIFLGARGLGALDRLLLGSVSTAVVSHAPCSVEVVRPSGEA